MKAKHTPVDWRRILADQLIQLVIDGDLPAEPVAESLRDAGIGERFTLDEVTVLVVDAAEAATTRDLLRADCQHFFDHSDHVPRNADLAGAADALALDFDLAYEHIVTQLVARPAQSIAIAS